MQWSTTTQRGASIHFHPHFLVSELLYVVELLIALDKENETSQNKIVFSFELANPLSKMAKVNISVTFCPIFTKFCTNVPFANIWVKFFNSKIDPLQVYFCGGRPFLLYKYCIYV